ncbi:MAG: alpha/beta hydrolase [Lactobacillaceae bacterium]|jgi:acetyl esterase/lipase|nr:alpha/beta hydrolase [Lactobacillaceae bacterium]
MEERFIDRQYTHVPADTTQIERKWLDVPYMPGAHHTLDIYLPNTDVPAYPVILDLYGGGLILGAKSSFKLEPAIQLMEQGYAVVSMDYSLITQAPFPTQVYEVKAAIRWLKANAAQYQLDATKIVLMGESSGAHLAVMAGISADAAVNDVTFGLHPEQSSTVQAIIAMYGPYAFDQFTAQFAASGVAPKYVETGTAESFEAQMFGGVAPSQVPDAVAKANPASYLSADVPPILAFAGTEDQVVPYQQSVNLIEAVRHFVSAKQAELHIIEGAHHGIHEYMTPENVELKVAFLKRWVQ